MLACQVPAAAVAGTLSSMLNGIKVLDLSRVLAGPYCTQLLGDLGADVWKVESPRGDETRAWGPPYIEGESTYYLSVNRNKRSIVLDLKNPDGVELVRQLARKADVMVENFKAGDLKRYGLDDARSEERRVGKESRRKWGRDAWEKRR